MTPITKSTAWIQNNGPRLTAVVLGVLLLVVAGYALWPHRQSIFHLLSNNPLIVLLTMAGIAILVWQSISGRDTWRPDERDISMIILVVIFALAGGVYLTAAIRHLASPATAGAAARIATLWALAYCAGGFFVGFLFGIPKVLQKEDPKSSAFSYVQLTNTNLEQISDWLTKIIVGLGLVELKELPIYLSNVAEVMAESFAPAEAVQHSQIASICSSVVVFFSVVGFLSGYLITRLYLSGAFLRAARAQEKSDQGISKDNEAKQLRDFWMPSDNPDAGNEKLLLAWMSKMSLDTDIASFINLPEYAAQRRKAVEELLTKNHNA